MNSTGAKSTSLIAFMKKLLKEHTGKKLWMCFDNPPVRRSKVLKKWLAKHPRVALNYLPRHSQDINQQEQWWKHESMKLLNNHYFDSNRRLNSAVPRFMRNTPSGTVKSICNIKAIEGLLK